jgi:hypothetical protein
MAVPKPFKRTCRPFDNGEYPDNLRYSYLSDPDFAKEPLHYLRAFELIQKDLQELFDYVEPADQNEKCYSYRIHELHMRTCMEVEVNCKAIMAENGYRKASGYWNMTDYKKLDATHNLSSYQVKFPVWRGTNSVRCPFSPWSSNGELSWYQAYNEAKHDRHNEFEQANFEHLLQAVAGLITLLSAQFYSYDFALISNLTTGYEPNDKFVMAIGNYLLVQFPTANDWPPAELYKFNWEQLKNTPDRFGTLQF